MFSQPRKDCLGIEMTEKGPLEGNYPNSGEVETPPAVPEAMIEGLPSMKPCPS